MNDGKRMEQGGAGRVACGKLSVSKVVFYQLGAK